MISAWQFCSGAAATPPPPPRVKVPLAPPGLYCDNDGILPPHFCFCKRLEAGFGKRPHCKHFRCYLGRTPVWPLFPKQASNPCSSKINGGR